MEEPMTKESMIEFIRSESEALNHTLGRIDRQMLEERGVEGDWSVKDILSHLSTWRRMLIIWIRESLEGKTPDRPAPDEPWDDLDQLNYSLYLGNRDRSPEDVLTEFASAQTDTLAVVAELSDADLLDPDRFAWRHGVPLWHMVAGNTWLHDREHNESIGHWLAAREGRD